MIELKIKNTYVRLSFTFFLSVALFLQTNGGFEAATLCSCVIHELSHLILMIIFGIPSDEILFYGAGVCISSRRINNAKKIQRTLILLAGCAGNIVAATVLVLTGYNVAAVINLFTAFFNILPIGSLDGAQILQNFVERHCKPENVDKVMRIAGISSAVLLVTIIILGKVSFYFSVITLYIVFVSCLKS